MPQINTSVGEHTIEELKNIAEQSHKSFSKFTCEMIELGLRVHKMQSEDEKSDEDKKRIELQQKHTEYLLQTLNLNREILRCVFNGENVKYNSKDANELVEKIKDMAGQYIEGYLGKEH